jgi:hypothetical protein
MTKWIAAKCNMCNQKIEGNFMATFTVMKSDEAGLHTEREIDLCERCYIPFHAVFAGTAEIVEKEEQQ